MNSGDQDHKTSLRVTDHAEIQHRPSQGSLPHQLTAKLVLTQLTRSNGISSLSYIGCYEDSSGWKHRANLSLPLNLEHLTSAKSMKPMLRFFAVGHPLLGTICKSLR